MSFVSIADGRVVEVLPYTVGQLVAHAVDTSAGVGYVTGTLGLGLRELHAIETASGRVLWRLPMSDAITSVLYDGVRLGGSPLAFDPASRHLVFGFSSSNDTLGLAVLNPSSSSVVAFRGPWRVFHVEPLPHAGLLAVTVRGETDANLQASHGVLLVDPISLALLDSLALPPPLSHAGVAASSLDGDRLYMGNDHFLFIYSRAEGRVLKAVPRPAHGALVLSPDGTMLVLSDPGLWPNYPGSGEVFIFDQELNLQGSVALPPDAETGLAVSTSRMVFSKDGRWLFVGAGTPPIGPLYGSQRSHVHVFEARTMRLHKSIPLDDWGSPAMFPLR